MKNSSSLDKSSKIGLNISPRKSNNIILSNEQEEQNEQERRYSKAINNENLKRKFSVLEYASSRKVIGNVNGNTSVKSNYKNRRNSWMIAISKLDSSKASVLQNVQNQAEMTPTNAGSLK